MREQIIKKAQEILEIDEENEGEGMAPDFWIVGFDETVDWSDWEKIKDGSVEAIVSYYLYDGNSHTYAVEMTPSYELFPIITKGFLRADLYEPGEYESYEERDAIEEGIMESAGYDVIYVHVSDVDAIPETHKIHIGDEGLSSTDAEEYEGIREEVIEYYNANAAALESGIQLP